MRAIGDLLSIIGAGGGYTIPAVAFTIEQLVEIAATARTPRSRITITGAAMLSYDDCVRIAAAGGGAVAFVE
jgi:hypothetical protein